MWTQLKRGIWKAGLLTSALSLLAFNLAAAASGDLDATFSGDGKQTTDFGGKWDESIYGMARQSDGKIVAVGHRFDPLHYDATTHDFALARYKTDGSLDATFSGDGKQLTNFGGVDRAFSAAIQSDGKIVVSGIKCNASDVCDLAVARYNPNGTLDTTFSGDGKQLVPFGSGDNGTGGGIGIQSDGKIVIGGYMTNTSGDLDFAVYRLRPNGSMDAAFSGDGRVSFGFGAGRDDEAKAMVLSGGKILIAGMTCPASAGDCNFAVARLTANGMLDPTFSGDGRQTTDFGGSDSAWDVAMQAGGKVVVTGEKRTDSNSFIALVRYNPDGSLDTTFSGDGKQTILFGSWCWSEAVLIQGDGKIVVAGMGDGGAEDEDFALARLNNNGTLDTNFSGDGKLLISFWPGKSDSAWALVRQPDGKYVLGGRADKGTDTDFALVRVLP